MKRICIFFVLCLICSVSNAKEFEVDEIRYSIDYWGNVWVIYNEGYKGDFVIPQKVTYESEEYIVSGIDQFAFSNNKEITSITIPNSIQSIGGDAFKGCSNLCAVYINDLEAWCNIPFKGSNYANPLRVAHHLFLNGEEVKDLVIPEGITIINALSFCGMSNLISISFPKSVTEVEDLAFYQCDNIKRINIEDLNAWCNIKFTRESSTCTISNPLGTAKHLYLNGEEIINLVIPNTVTDLKDYTFYQCKGLETISFPSGISSIGIRTFGGCSNVSELTLSSGLTTIKEGAFQGLNLVKELNIPEGVTSIGNSAFSGLKSLSSISWPLTLETIGETAFSGCINLTKLDIPNNVIKIGDGAFSSCDGLFSVKLPNKLARINPSLFSECYNLQSIEIPESITAIGNNAFNGCIGLTSVIIPKKIETIGEYAFFNCSGLEMVDMSEVEDLHRIWHHAFQNCAKMSSLLFPIKLNDIGNFAFSNCSSLKTLELPNNLEGIGEYAFDSCNGLTDIDIPNSVIAINEAAFANCKSLVKISIPKRLKTIPKGIIANCTSIKDVYCYNNEIPSTSPYAFAQSLVENATLHVPEESINIYKSRAPWNYFKEIVSLEASGINSVFDETNNNNIWYDLNGNKLGEEPNSKGIYINNGKKVLK